MAQKKESNFMDIIKSLFSSSKEEDKTNENGAVFLKLFENLPAVIYARDNKDNLIIASEQAKEILGITDSDSPSVMSKEYIKKDEELDKTVLDNQKSFEENITYINSKNHTRIATIKKLPITLKGKKPNVVLTMLADNTDRLSKETEIINSKDLLKNILDNAPMAIYTRGASGGLTFWNKKTMEMFEDDEETVARPGAHPMQDKNEAASYQTREEEILQEGKVVIYPQEPYTTRNGHKLMLHITKIPMPPSGDTPECVLTIVQDITERYLQEQENAKNQNLIQTILNNAPLAIYARDSEGNMIFRNKSSSYVHGYQLGEQPNETPEQIEFYKHREQSIFKDGKPVVLGEEEYTGNDGKKRILRAIKAPIYDSKNKPLMIVTITEDVTEKHKQELEILHARNFLNEIIDNLPVALYAKDYDGKYILWNKKCTEIFGKTAKEVLGKTYYNDSLNPEQKEFIAMQDSKVFDMRKELDIPQELISTQSGDIKIMHTVKMPLFYEDGSPHCLLAISEDITLKTKMEKQVYEAKTQYSLLVENCREGILIIEQGKISFANKTLLSSLDYNLEDMEKKPFLDFVDKGNKTIAEEFYDKISSQTASQEFVTLKLKAKNEDIVEFETSGVRAKYLGKRIVILFMRNITREIRQESDGTITKEAKFKMAFDSVKTPQVILQQNGYIYDMNQAARRLLGFTTEDRPLYGSLYVLPGFPLHARRALINTEPCDFEGVIDFDRLKKTVPELVKKGSLKLAVKMTPFNIREGLNSKQTADFLLELACKEDGLTVDEVSPSLSWNDVLAYKDGVLLCSQKGDILKCNKEAEKLLGKNINILKKANISDIFIKQDTDYLRKDIKELYSQGTFSSREYTLSRSCGGLTLECEAVLAKEDNFLLIFRNNTGKRQLLEVLEERTAHNEALKRCLGGVMLECLLSKNKKEFTFSKFMTISPEVCALSGYTRQELSKLSLPDLMCGISKDTEEEKQKIVSLLNNYAELLFKGQTVNFDSLIVFKTRKTICSLIMTLYKTAGENRVVIILKEIAKEIEIAQNLDEASKELEGIKESLDGVYLKLDNTGKVISCGIGKGKKLAGLSSKDVLNKRLEDFLSKKEAKNMQASLREVFKKKDVKKGSITVDKDGQSYLYEYSLSPIPGEDKAQMFVNKLDNRKGFEEKVKHLYTILNRTDVSFVDNMDAILNYGNEIVNSEAALICHLSGEDKEDILVNYVTDNKIKLEQGQEFKIGSCLAPVKNGETISISNFKNFKCKRCLHAKNDLQGLWASPLSIKGRVEGLVCFVSTKKNTMRFGDQEENLMVLIANLMSMALETRRAKKATSNSLTTMRHLMKTLDVPAFIADEDLNIKNANDNLFAMFDIQDMAEIDDKNIFSIFAFNKEKAEDDFESAQRTSKGGVFDYVFEVKLPKSKRLNLLWHVVEVKDGRGKVRGYMFASENIQDLGSFKSVTNERYHGF
ncbi:MAG: PAS domain S-box protein [Elusimicrobiaceae bacterium]|nr:PAS domain S-box protein [Elusimicrobiaceae bacterium]